VEGDDAVLLGELTRLDVAHGNRARAAFVPPEAHVPGKAELEEVVTGDHEQMVVEPGRVHHELHVADGAEAIVVRGRAVVVDRQVAAGRPLPKRGRLARVRDDVDLVDVLDGGDGVHDAVDDRTSTYRQELLGPRFGEWAEPGRIAGREDDRLHAATVPASDCSYGERWTPASVTIAETSSPGVTSNAGL